MALSRIYCPETLTTGVQLTLDEKTAHRLVSVMRLTPRDTIEIFNERQGNYRAHIDNIQKKSVTIKIGDFMSHPSAPSLYTHLVQGISRNERMDYTLQKATELGIQRITPILTEYCQIPNNTDFAKRHAHWQAILISATEQSGRCDVPLLDPVCTFKEVLQESTSTTRLILEPDSVTPLTAILQSPHGYCFLIGPEGGFSSTEIEQAQEANILPVRLGSIILRTETVAPVVLSILHARFGDFR
jgi:16S rRNA (uracil1498-N3)-methyltransferase